MGAGSINNPEKKYHLECKIIEINIAKIIVDIMKKNDIYFKKRKFKKSSSFTIYYQLSDNPYPRIGLLVGKKNGIAVIRNKIKRQVRTFVDKYIDKDLNLNLIIAMTRNYDITKFEENEKEFEKLINSIKGDINE